jgi:hypothetical protein
MVHLWPSVKKEIMNYIKINTIWKRDEKNKGRIIEGDFSKQEFANIKKWEISEKIDGMNIRITFTRNIDQNQKSMVVFGGKTDDAQIPARLVKYLQETFPESLLSFVFEETANKIILFGEGYGAKIQKGGGLYRKDVGVIIFDVWIDGWWLEREKVNVIAKSLNVKSVPVLGIMDIETAIELVKSKPNSLVAEEPKVIEGIVARSYPLMLFRDGTPITWKLKVRDFKD